MIKETILELINNDFINTGKIYFSNNIPIQISNAIYSFEVMIYQILLFLLIIVIT
ncbi:MAG: hypothetical protein ACLTAI_13020 [Thomasclavelia sp.]